MRASHIRLAALALTSGLVLGGCAYDDYGYGYGQPYGYGYPHSSVSIGIGYGGGYGGYGYSNYGYPYGGYYGGYGYPYGGYGAYGGYGYDPFGWYGNYYYPGTGIYVYDRSRTRHVWSGDQQRYWQQRSQQYQRRSGTAAATGENWSGWDRRNRSNTASTWTRGSNNNWTRNNSQATTSTTTANDGSQQPRGSRGRHRGDRND